ncbi:threonine--tRNA ligase [Achromobacter xylosoxidans]|jgi:threonyl-tRNA synthetase|uniref:Threonine--tRNA ligase n=3 Tax=Alcaligenes xylosoxydans xylosoxydans TaxID=85698 RepID=A0A0D6H5X7_ALCXX|nr:MULTISPECIES: threonine--tRNA ligase [Achromobacter]AHC46539.1 Threonyl-tRNA synthetase [Achromobacter xylosoxidans NBRC 15126 = ATCC 27061]AUZ19930.1 threonine--tRNA ligase [Achromobacter xylosoxidans]AXA76756.1 threonine--tRNA ligase [Achromobacter xylosoxidans]EFV83787.1 threonyl-tRNA synthetase [Achromobacter xylosoxidans C54]KAA5924320.1 threonine--tRNA ligase [Achromobacter xylosoxidans]
MVQITLPDGSQRQYPGPVTVAEVAQSIGAGLAKAALGGRVTFDGADSTLVDTSYRIEGDARLAIVTAKDADGLDMIRHSTAHLLAYAVKELFPDAQVTIGPVIDNGFYYDFSYKRPFTPEDLAAIEKKMAELAKKDEVVTREVWSRDDAVEFFKGIGEKYKAEIIASIPSNEPLSLYREGEFIDLCRGPHVPSTGKLKVFKLMKVAGAYWRGDSKNEMLQRIYGTAWATKEEQEAYLHMLEEAERRDHRKIGRELDLFHFQDEAPGLIFWHPKGWALWQQVEQYMRSVYRDNGYQEVKAPQILDISLWKKTGHWDNYRENMFTTESENRVYGLKPMNCPGHVQIFNAGLHSYRELPLRYGEFGQCHRNEPSGSLHGMMRVRGFTQDDGHIFCTEEQLQDECADFTALLQKVYRDFGFTEVLYKVATRPEKRIGSDEVWDTAEQALMESLRRTGCEFEISPGEGAFYGPKVEYTLKDAIGRHWQCGTIQVDFSMPVRLGAEYVDQNDQRRPPVMLHRAILGSLERFIGMLIENHAGAMPPWLAPVQAVVCCISEPSADYAAEITQSLKKQGFRVESDLRGEKITRKIREHSLQKVPYILVVGDKEKQNGTVAVRGLGGLDLGAIAFDDFVARLSEDVSTRRDVNQPDGSAA